MKNKNFNKNFKNFPFTEINHLRKVKRNGNPKIPAGIKF